MKVINLPLCLIIFITVIALQPVFGTEKPFSNNQKAQNFLDVKPDQSVLDNLKNQQSNNGEPTSTFNNFRQRYNSDTFIRRGCSNKDKYSATLSKMERVYGVPAPVILSIWGIESRFGRYTGRHEARRALLALAQSKSNRADFFADQLHALTRSYLNRLLPHPNVKSSWAGALGQPQFLPSNYIQYAVDVDKDGYRDIWNSDRDVIGSIANYLKLHGWKRGWSVFSSNEYNGSKVIQTDNDQYPVTPNYDVVLNYNPSRFYALMVGVLEQKFKNC